MVSFAPVLTLFDTLAVIAQLPNTRILRLSVLVSIGMLEWGASTRHNFDGSESLNTLGHSQLDEHRMFWGHHLRTMPTAWLCVFHDAPCD